MDSDRPFESKLNIVLSTILNEKLGIQSISEKGQAKGRPDIVIFSGGIKIVVEASYSKQDAENDVNKKVENGFADIGISLFYMEKIRDVNDSHIKGKLERLKFEKLFIPQDIRNTLDYYIKGQHHVPLHGQLYSVELDFEQLQRLKHLQHRIQHAYPF